MKLNAISRYWEVQIADVDRDKTDFTSSRGLFHFSQLPFGLKIVQGMFRQAMDVLLTKVKWNFSFVRLNDIIIFSHTTDEHIDHSDK